jgi:hypothetical protein
MHTHTHNIVSSPSVLCRCDVIRVPEYETENAAASLVFPVINVGRYADCGGHCRVALPRMIVQVQFAFPVAWFELLLWRHVARIKRLICHQHICGFSALLIGEPPYPLSPIHVN